jgi:hypothetical protein
MARKQKDKRVKDFSHAGEVVDMIEILSRGGVHSSADLAEELNRPKRRISGIVRRARQMFMDGSDKVDVRVYSTKGGYTIEEKPEHVMHEARFRICMAAGVLLNGAHVFKTARQIAQKDFITLQVEYKPRMIEMGKLIK